VYDDATSFTNNNIAFDLTLVNPCLSTTLVDPAVSNVSGAVLSSNTADFAT
jgi:hypothetical protein